MYYSKLHCLCTQGLFVQFFFSLLNCCLNLTLKTEITAVQVEGVANKTTIIYACFSAFMQPCAFFRNFGLLVYFSPSSLWLWVLEQENREGGRSHSGLCSCLAGLVCWAEGTRSTESKGNVAFSCSIKTETQGCPKQVGEDPGTF